jgi:hypothetical protein
MNKLAFKETVIKWAASAHKSTLTKEIKKVGILKADLECMIRSGAELYLGEPIFGQYGRVVQEYVILRNERLNRK